MYFRNIEYGILVPTGIEPREIQVGSEEGIITGLIIRGIIRGNDRGKRCNV